MTQNILITGGAGFIGTALCRRLVGAGHRVTLIDNLSPQIHGDSPSYAVPEGASFQRIDIRAIADHPKLVEAQDAIYHLAAETGTGQSMYRIAQYVDVNEMGTARLLEMLARNNTRRRRFILASSRSIYGEGAYTDPAQPGSLYHPEPRSPEQLAQGLWDFQNAEGKPLVAIPTPETLPAKPGSVYAGTKMAQELLVRSAAVTANLHPVIFRFQNVFGEGQSLRNPYTGIISIFFNRARQGLPINIFEDGLESRDFVHIDDIVTALVLALDADIAAGMVMNVGAGEASSVIKVAETLCRLGNVKVPVTVTGDYRVGDIRHCYADMRAIRAALHFTPKVSLEAGLQRFVAWASSQPAFEDLSQKATAELQKFGLAKA